MCLVWDLPQAGYTSHVTDPGMRTMCGMQGDSPSFYCFNPYPNVSRFFDKTSPIQFVMMSTASGYSHVAELQT